MPKSAVPLRDIMDRTELAKRPAPVPLSSFWKLTALPSTYGVIWVAAGAVGVHHERVVMPGARARPGEEHVVARIAAPEADAEGVAELRRVRIDDEPAVVRVEVRSELHREVVVVAVGVPLQPELDRQLRAWRRG